MEEIDKTEEINEIKQEDIEFTLDYKVFGGEYIKKLESVKIKDVVKHVIYPEYHIKEDQVLFRLQGMNKQKLGETKKYYLVELRAHGGMPPIKCFLLRLTRTK